jgi:transposase
MSHHQQRTTQAPTAEHAVDLETGAIVGVTVQDADEGDTTSLVETLTRAADHLVAVAPTGLAEVVADKGYHSNHTLAEFAAMGVRSYVSEPDRGRRNWTGQAAAKQAVYADRRRIPGARGKRLLRPRGERLERPNAHLYETGGMRRVHLRGHPNILKRLLVQVCGFNLGLLLRQLSGVGTPRSLPAAIVALLATLSRVWTLRWPAGSLETPNPPNSFAIDLMTGCHEHLSSDLRIGASTTGC